MFFKKKKQNHSTASFIPSHEKELHVLICSKLTREILGLVLKPEPHSNHQEGMLECTVPAPEAVTQDAWRA